MCGIGGLVSFQQPPDALRPSARLIQRRLHHRGPDEQGEARVSHGVLVHTRLVLRDRAAGRQPCRSEDGRYTLVFNGELYDIPAALHGDLRGDLHGAFPAHPTEGAALLALWARHGVACLPRLNGMFAFFIWDDLAQEGFLVRDRLGVKPAAYAWDGELFRFASEAQALLPQRPRAHLPAVLEALVAPAFSGVAHSAFEGIDYLQPGCWLRVSRAGLSKGCWAKPPACSTVVMDPGHDDSHADRLLAELREALPRAVQRSLVSDTPLGVFLSGGLDSTLIASCLEEARGPCFSIAFEHQGSFRYQESAIVISDDAPFVAQARQELGLHGYDVAVRQATLAQDLIELAAINDALPVWEQELAQHHLTTAARVHVKAVLVGDAADETHYGYHFLWDAHALGGGDDHAFEALLSRLGSVPIRRDVLADPVRHFAQQYRELVAEDGARWGSRDERILATTSLLQRRWLPRLLHNGDIYTMRGSLEARVPFADRDLLDIAGRVPPSLGLRDGVEKWALREASRGLVPEAIRTRRKSALPKDQAAGPLYKELAAAVLREPPPLVAELVDLEVLRSWLPAERPLSEAERAALFRFVTLAHWTRHHGINL